MNERREKEKAGKGERMLDNLGRLIVTLMWAVLLVVLVAVVILAQRFYG